MEADILVPKKYKNLFKVAVEDANGGRIIVARDMGMLSDEDISGNPLGVEIREYLACKIEYKSPQSLFDTGIDFAFGLVGKTNETKKSINN